MIGNVQAIVCLLGFALCFNVSAAEVVLELEVEMGYESDSNVKLTKDNKTKIQGGVVSPELRLSRNTPQMDFSLDIGADFLRFDESSYHTDNQDVNVEVEYRRRQQKFGAGASLVKNSTQTSELEDTGRFQDGAIRREEARFDVQWEYMFNQSNAVELRVYDRDVRYETSFLIDYEFVSTALVYTHILSNRMSFIAQGFAQRYENQDSDSESYGGLVGVTAAVSKTLSFSVLAGTSDTEQTLNGSLGSGRGDSNNWVADASLVYQQRKYRLSAEFVRSITPSGNGFVQETNIGRGSWVYQASERISLVANLTLGENEAFELERKFQSYEGGVRYRVAEAWKLSAMYRYRTQNQLALSGTAHTHAMFFTLSYAPRARTWKS